MTIVTFSAHPWFAPWNHQLLEALFRYIPQSEINDDRFETLIQNPILGTWIFAAVFYWLWSKDDEQLSARRLCLFRTLVAIGIAFLLTGVIRPWVDWPAPVLNPGFQPLFPHYLWGNGSWNCFPSHSTLAYFTLAAGLWPLKRVLSVSLCVLALAFVSLPRVYVGGHYPIDVLFSCVLGILVLLGVWRWPVPASVSNWLMKRGPRTTLRDWMFFLWTFEVGEGFRGAEFLAAFARQLWHGR